MCLAGAVTIAVASAAEGVALLHSSQEGRGSGGFGHSIPGAEARESSRHFRCGVFLGTGWSDDKVAAQLPRWEAEGRWFNPFTGKRFDPHHDRIFAFGKGAVPGDLPRVVAHHFGLRLFDSLEKIAGYSFDYLICHSNGCTEAFQALNTGTVRARYVFALGSDTTAQSLVRGELGGARVIYFVVRGDPIPKSAAVMLGKAAHAPALEIRIPFGPGGPDVIVLERPPGSSAHSLVDAYFPAISKRKGRKDSHPVLVEIANFLRAVEVEADSEDRAGARGDSQSRPAGGEDEETVKADHRSPGCPPHCPPRCPPDCPPGKAPPSSNPPPQNPPERAVASGGPGNPTPGGISVRIPVGQKDFERVDPSKGRRRR